MEKLLRILFFAVFGGMLLAGTAEGQIIISQYAEEGNIKGIELRNVSGSQIDFSNQTLKVNRYANGSTSPTEDFSKSSGTLADGEVLVVADDGNSVWADNGVTFETAELFFNGNDALEIVLGGNTTDVFGKIGNDPGSSWDGNGVSTQDQNIQLLSGISSGDTDGWTDPSTRFETVDSGTLDDGVDNGGLSGFMDVDGFGDSEPLPVEFTSFDVTANADRAVLSWTTSSETNNAGFAIQQRTSDGNWTKSGFVKGAGTTTEAQSYRFTTDALAGGTHTFRLKQIDTDGTAHYSDPKTVTIRAEAGFVISGPNPLTTGQTAELQVQVKSEQSVEIALYDVLGQRVRTVTTNRATPDRPVRTAMSTEGLSSGVYFLRATGSSFQETRKISILR